MCNDLTQVVCVRNDNFKVRFTHTTMISVVDILPGVGYYILGSGAPPQKHILELLFYVCDYPVM